MNAASDLRCRFHIACVLLAVSLLTAGCIMGDAVTEVEGIVVDDRGVPIGGVTITFRPQPSQANLAPPFVGTTDDQGRFFVGRGHRPSPSQFIVEAKKEGYRPATIKVQGCEIHRGVRIVLVSEPGGPAVMSGKPKG